MSNSIKDKLAHGGNNLELCANDDALRGLSECSARCFFFHLLPKNYQTI